MRSRRERAEAVTRRLAAVFPAARCELDHDSPWQLLVATVLSAQCTDQRVNRVTPELFARWPAPEDLARAPAGELEEVIRTTGFQHRRARALRAMAETVVGEHGGAVPPDADALLQLPGVGRKTVKVVLGEAFGIAEGLAVDTHARRVSQRLGLSAADDPERIAADLEALVPRAEWIQLSLRLILHGRRTCTARRPACAACALEDLCPRVGVG
jgi:endonuclease-3